MLHWLFNAEWLAVVVIWFKRSPTLSEMHATSSAAAFAAETMCRMRASLLSRSKVAPHQVSPAELAPVRPGARS